MRRYHPVLTNVVIAVTLCALVEGGSWAVIKTYQWSRSGTHDAAGVLYLPETKGESGTIDLTSKYSSPGVPEDLDRNATMPGSPFQYESYVVYRNRPFSSEHVNIVADGRRMNARSEPTPTPDTIHVWMFGSSAPWGATNGDDETIAAYLQKALAHDLGKPVAVANYAVVGYTSWQDMLSFAEHLRNQPKPDLVLFFNGLNDHYRGWLNETLGHLEK